MQLPSWATRNIRTLPTRPQATIRPVLSLFVPVLFLSLATARPLHGQSPAVAARYMGRKIATTMHYTGADWLMRESRQREEDCKRLLKELHVKPGQIICDMGCGNGFYTLKLAQLTGTTGRVYAVDIQQEMLDMLQQRAKAAKLENISPLLGTDTDPRLPENSIDLVLMVDVYHEFSRPEAMMKAIRKSLKPGGRIALVEFRAEDPKVPIKPEHKMSKRQILKEFPANGLKLTDQFDELPWQHLMFFSRDDGRNRILPKPCGEPLFVSGQDGYHTYRIPALAVTTQGTVLAFCEGRKKGNGDSGDIDLLVKRSSDDGKTWSGQQVVWDDGGNTCGNPCVVVDRDTGTVWLLSTWNRGDDHEPGIIAQTSKDTRRVFAIHSTDDGRTWSTPQEITAGVKKNDWTWYATGPGSGIQIEHGPHRGRLVIPCDHIEAGTKHYYSHVIYSDDHGKSWKLGGSTPQHQVNECEVVELAGGKLMLNMRNYDRSQKNRQAAISEDGGLTWKEQRFDEDIDRADMRGRYPSLYLA